ncbi:MAG: nudix hydrolase 1 [Candidatus Parcubacteria bacterium]|jgi:8-oxo-dGTP pyrophosphatase MutT (NUDIX family)
MRNATLVFLVKKADGIITDVCLAMKLRGFGKDRWNGTGGKVQENESIEVAAKRETKEEVNVDVKSLEKVGELQFTFPHNSAWNQMVHVYVSENFEGEPTESEEMRPEWFSIDEIPYGAMWAADAHWIPTVMAGKKIRGSIVFGEEDVVLDAQVEEVEEF